MLRLVQVMSCAQILDTVILLPVLQTSPTQPFTDMLPSNYVADPVSLIKTFISGVLQILEFTHN